MTMKWERGSTEGSDDVEGKVEVLAARGKLEFPFWQGRIRGRLAVGLARVGMGMLPVSLTVALNFTTFIIFKKSICKSSFLFHLSFPFLHRCSWIKRNATAAIAIHRCSLTFSAMDSISCTLIQTSTGMTRAGPIADLAKVPPTETCRVISTRSHNDMYRAGCANNVLSTVDNQCSLPVQS